MSIHYECDQCDHSGSVSPAKAGRKVKCPACGAAISIPVVDTQPARSDRLSSDDGQMLRVIGIGLAVLVVGLGLLFAVKSMQTDDSLQDASLAVNTNQAITESASNPRMNAQRKVEATTPVAGTLVADAQGNGDQSDEEEGSADLEETNYVLPEMTAVDPQQILLAGLSNIALKISRLEQDSRGAATEAVKASVKRAIQSCMLTANPSDTDPALIVELSLDKSTGRQRLKLDATLEGDMQGLPVRFWQNSDAVIALDDRDLKSGMMPPGLDREVGVFFMGLRKKVMTARRIVNARIKTKELQDSQ